MWHRGQEKVLKPILDHIEDFVISAQGHWKAFKPFSTERDAMKRLMFLKVHSHSSRESEYGWM